MNRIPTSFQVELYGELTAYSRNPDMSQSRVRAFYRGFNRNSTEIKDEVAKMLIDSAPGMPIVGKYDKEKQDFTMHWTVEETKGYGFVPPDLDFAWETHVDSDGIAREYACFNVVLWTHRYEEAKTIIAHPQSMELNPKSISGQWVVINGEMYFQYSAAKLMGLCVLGKDVEPCFEGASFYNKKDEPDTNVAIAYFENMQEEILKNFSLLEKENKIEVIENTGGDALMKVNFGSSHDNFQLLFEAVNPQFTEEGKYLIENVIGKVSDDSFEKYDFESGKHTKVMYTIVDGKVELGTEEEIVPEPIYQVTEPGNDENVALQEVQTQFSIFKAEKETLTAELQATIETLNKEKTNLTAQLGQFQRLAKEAEDKRKSDLLESYQQRLNEDELSAIAVNVEQFSYEELEGKLAVTFMRKVQDVDLDKIPLGNLSNEDPVVACIRQFKNKKGGN